MSDNSRGNTNIQDYLIRLVITHFGLRGASKGFNHENRSDPKRVSFFTHRKNNAKAKCN